jgi:hypothetical protein
MALVKRNIGENRHRSGESSWLKAMAKATEAIKMAKAKESSEISKIMALKCNQ